ncbi:double-strand break repair protein MRE11A [Thecamonas trahens ATCC 50062]|uniref:Double-strand break repair protein n=1 Tax=Thecamonas trahens ATCC 50062 TaxID=461836 RepID=A0A0L0DS31_THETB|nr:double-strand break repair protein MRE11A [Thecamonas trahens ATCC 50062]KNC55052.1 double-strand break repair protein MRE11A [Thecamonas trahens ATCC 50062]|eukprot:XP_013753356.1 double-strand break repair protein MRE11A [Thecamonas trahens ATCC 50062]
MPNGWLGFAANPAFRVNHSSFLRLTDSVFKILITTDNHVGYAEDDPVRGGDSFEAFEEVLKIAEAEAVDFILLGGDLFDKAQPSRHAMYEVMRLLRKYCMGTGEPAFSVVSDMATNFHSSFGKANMADANLRVRIPVFSIHGNHDDPVGGSNLAALDILAMAGLVNYFGKSPSVEDITVSPVLLQKGSSKLALYGLGNIRDERLNRAFSSQRVKCLRPREDADSWFNLFVLHQNRVNHSPKNCIHEEQLDDFIDLVFWGHEHEALIEPVKSAVRNFCITQPGSTVATSLCAAETRPKGVGILRICGDKFNIQRVNLASVRPFLIDDYALRAAPETVNIKSETAVAAHLADIVEDMLVRVAKEFPPPPSGESKLPLLRLRVDSTGGETCNPRRFGQAFVNRVANPGEILLFQKPRRNPRAQHVTKALDPEAAAAQLESMKSDASRKEFIDGLRVENLVSQALADSKASMNILPEDKLQEAVSQFVTKEEKTAIKNFVAETLKKTQSELRSRNEAPILEEDAARARIEALVADRNRKATARRRRAAAAAAAASPTAPPSEAENENEVDEAEAEAGKDKGKAPESESGSGSRSAAPPLPAARSRSSASRKSVSRSSRSKHKSESESGSESDVNDDESSFSCSGGASRPRPSSRSLRRASRAPASSPPPSPSASPPTSPVASVATAAPALAAPVPRRKRRRGGGSSSTATATATSYASKYGRRATKKQKRT